jgi:hypothetical protein
MDKRLTALPAELRRRLRNRSRFLRNESQKEITATVKIMGTNHLMTRSANLCTGALEACASSTR